MKRLTIILVAALALVATTLGQMIENKSQTGVEPSPLSAERAWADAFTRREAIALEEILADEFSFKSPGGRAVNKSDFVAAVRNASGVYESIRLVEQSEALSGDTGVTSGRAVVSERAGATTVRRVAVEPVAATQTATVHFAELARESAAKPPSNEPEKYIAIPSPASGPDDEQPAPAASDSLTEKQYRYEAAYVRRAGRWQLVSLQLSPVAPPSTPAAP